MSKDQKVYWPSWRYTQDGQAKVFQSAEEVPEGWYTQEELAQLSAPDAAPPENGKNAWGGYAKTDLEKKIRDSGGKIHANSTARSLYKKAVKQGLIDDSEGEDKKED